MSQIERQFKGWTRPGREIVSATPVPTVDSNETLDFVGGYFRIFQLADGHRFSTDDLATAWYGTQNCPRAETVLDLGSGIGSVALMSAFRLPGARFTTIEAQDVSIGLARKSVALNGLSARFDLRHGDLRTPGILGDDERFDLITGSPPYFPVGTGVASDHSQKFHCRFEVRGDVSDYCRVAARHLEPGGVFACVFPIDPLEQLKRVETAAKANDLFIVKRRALTLKAGERSLLSVFMMMKKEDLPESFLKKGTLVEPELVIREKDGSPGQEYQTVKLVMGFPP